MNKNEQLFIVAIVFLHRLVKIFALVCKEERT